MSPVVVKLKLNKIMKNKRSWKLWGNKPKYHLAVKEFDYLKFLYKSTFDDWFNMLRLANLHLWVSFFCGVSSFLLFKLFLPAKVTFFLWWSLSNIAIFAPLLFLLAYSLYRLTRVYFPSLAGKKEGVMLHRKVGEKEVYDYHNENTTDEFIDASTRGLVGAITHNDEGNKKVIVDLSYAREGVSLSYVLLFLYFINVLIFLAI